MRAAANRRRSRTAFSDRGGSGSPKAASRLEDLRDVRAGQADVLVPPLRPPCSPGRRSASRATCSLAVARRSTASAAAPRRSTVRRRASRGTWRPGSRRRAARPPRPRCARRSCRHTSSGRAPRPAAGPAPTPTRTSTPPTYAIAGGASDSSTQLSSDGDRRDEVRRHAQAAGAHEREREGVRRERDRRGEDPEVDHPRMSAALASAVSRTRSPANGRQATAPTVHAIQVT